MSHNHVRILGASAPARYEIRQILPADRPAHLAYLFTHYEGIQYLRMFPRSVYLIDWKEQKFTLDGEDWQDFSEDVLPKE